jgi:hypothetical protein
MRTVLFLSTVLLLGILLAKLRGTPTDAGFGNHAEASPYQPELEYLRAVNGVAPPRDPQLLFLLMGQYSNANLQGEGAEFFSARLKEFGPRLTDPQKSLYLSAIGLMRAQQMRRELSINNSSVNTSTSTTYAASSRTSQSTVGLS